MLVFSDLESAFPSILTPPDAPVFGRQSFLFLLPSNLLQAYKAVVQRIAEHSEPPQHLAPTSLALHLWRFPLLILLASRPSLGLTFQVEPRLPEGPLSGRASGPPVLLLDLQETSSPPFPFISLSVFLLLQSPARKLPFLLSLSQLSTARVDGSRPLCCVDTDFTSPDTG